MLSEIEVRREVTLSLLSEKLAHLGDSSDIISAAEELTDFILGKGQRQHEKETLVPKFQVGIINEIAETLAMFGAGSDLMAIVGSWGDTLPQEDILEMWREWNQAAKKNDWVAKPVVFNY